MAMTLSMLMALDVEAKYQSVRVAAVQWWGCGWTAQRRNLWNIYQIRFKMADVVTVVEMHFSSSSGASAVMQVAAVAAVNQQTGS